ncbi:MAG: adenylyltransferase/cytidyltransferase family protein [Deltaproteobacteria bacterium]|nr:adenylyltransferase/cytidyltransferase family protein [Deltaproteobacteria bacterium]
MLPRTDKIKPLQELAIITQECRSQKKKIVHCHGVFDLLHIGHIRYLEQARQMGDVLVVTITSDRFVDKGPHRPAFSDAMRSEAVASLSCVDYVAVNEWPTAEETLRLLRPDVYVKGAEFKDIGSDMTGRIDREAQVVQEIGAALSFTDGIVFSSTNLINRYLSNLPKEIDEYLELFRRRYQPENIMQVIDSMSPLRALVVGDTILDDYHFCEVIGKSSKDPTLAAKHLSSDMFAGGVLAVANHVANFVKEVTLVTMLGEVSGFEEFIRSQLHPNVSPHFFYQPNAPTIIKRRFIDGYSINKLFEVYVMDDSGLPPDLDQEACLWLSGQLRDYDLVIAADYGHGVISKQMVETMVTQAPFLAVNTQANAGNRGFHTVTRYPKADYACLAEHELRLERRSLREDVRILMNELVKQLGCSQLVVTRGRSGCSLCNDKGHFLQVPAFAQNIVDRVGAGDAFFAVTSLAAVQSVPAEVIGFIGNVVGSLAVEGLGNKKATDKLSVKKYITSLLK